MLFDVAPANQHHAWYPEDEAKQEYRDDDANRREAEARLKEHKPLPGTDEFAPSWVDYGKVHDNYTRQHDKPVYGELIDAGESDTFLPPEQGGTGKANPMDTVAEAGRLRAVRAQLGDKRARKWIADNRTTSWGEVYVKPHGEPRERALHGRPKYLRYFDAPTEKEAIRNLTTSTERDIPVKVYLDKESLVMLARLHNLMIERGDFTDKGRSAILAAAIGGMADDQWAAFRVYTTKDFLWMAKRAPKRFHKGEFGQLLAYLKELA